MTDPLKFSNPHVNRAADSIDASMFSGDVFMCADERRILREFMAPWERGLKRWEEIEAALAEEDESEEDQA